MYAYTKLVAVYQCISRRSGHLLVLYTGAVLGNTHILHCQTLSVIPLPLVRPLLVFILSKTQSSGRLTNQSKHGYFFWQHLFSIQSVGIPQCGLCVRYAWHLSKFWQTWHKRRPIMVAFLDTAWRWRYQLPSRSASINLRIICTMLMYCVHKLVKPFHKLTTWSTQLSQLSQL